MANSAYLEQIEQKINTLISEKKYKEAYLVCKEYLEKYPEEKIFIRLKEKIEKSVEIENERIIEEKLNKLEPLWKAQKYAEILQSLKELLKVAPNNNKIKNLYERAQVLYKDQYAKLENQFEKQQRERLTEMLNEHPEELNENLQILEKENQGNKNIKTLVAEFRDKLITKRIKEKADLLDSEKYDAIENFIEELLRIDQSSQKVLELENEIKARKIESSEVQTKEYVYGGEKHLDTLIKLKKYDKAIKAANEILAVEKNNEFAQKILKTAQAKYAIELQNKAADNIINNFASLKEEYLQDKSQFIKL